MRYMILVALIALPVILYAAETPDRELLLEEQHDAARRQQQELKDRARALEEQVQSSKELQRKQDDLIKALQAEINRRKQDSAGTNRTQGSGLDRDTGSPGSP